jgi:hypothetical protein
MWIPVPAWFALVIVVLGGLGWLYDMAVARPKRRRERNDRKQQL